MPTRIRTGDRTPVRTPSQVHISAGSALALTLSLTRTPPLELAARTMPRVVSAVPPSSRSRRPHLQYAHLASFVSVASSSIRAASPPTRRAPSSSPTAPTTACAS
eukprot:6193541-Pleurochrysis_carterae.AAC.1